MTTYYQCELSQGTGRTRGYIEDRGAKVGAMVEIKDNGFNGIWRVDAVSETGISEEKMRADQQMNRNAFGSIEPMRG
jgi:hypothetical protein